MNEIRLPSSRQWLRHKETPVSSHGPLGFFVIAVHVRIYADALWLFVERNEVDVHLWVFFSVTARFEYIRHQGDTQQELLVKRTKS